MSNGSYKLGYCKYCHLNVQHFRSRKSLSARVFDLVSMFVLNFGPWYCAQCERKTRCLPWIRKRQPTNTRLDDGTESVGNFIRSDGSLVLRKKRTGRYSAKFRQGVVQRLLSGRTNIAQLTVELKVTEADLMAWVGDVLRSRDVRIDELNGLLKSYHRAAANLIGISDESVRFDDEENLIEGSYKRQTLDSSNLAD